MTHFIETEDDLLLVCGFTAAGEQTKQAIVSPGESLLEAMADLFRVYPATVIAAVCNVPRASRVIRRYTLPEVERLWKGK